MTVAEPQLGPAATGGAAWAKTQPPGGSSKAPLIAIGAGLLVIAVAGVAIGAWRFRAARHASAEAAISGDPPSVDSSAAAVPTSSPTEPTEKIPVENDDPTAVADEASDAAAGAGAKLTTGTKAGTKVSTTPSSAKSAAKPPPSAKRNDWGY
jgi:hypothetical protein